MVREPVCLQEAVAFLEANGWAVVPKEPTKAMLDDGWYGATSEDAESTWLYMLKAAPTEAEIQGQSVVFARASNTPETGS